MLQRALEPDVDATQRHLRLLAGEDVQVAAFQVFYTRTSGAEVAAMSLQFLLFR